MGHEGESTYEISTAAQLAGLAYVTSPLCWDAEQYAAWESGASKLSAASVNARYATVEVADFAGKTVKLAADIDMQGSTSQVTKPIADINNLTPGAGGQGGSGGTASNVAWKGTFDGQGHTVSHVYIDWSSRITANYGGYQGLFSAVADGAVIQKVGVTGYIYGRVIGGIAGVSRFAGDQVAVETYPLIQNSWTNVTTEGNGSGSRPTGGIFGGESERSDWCHVINCYARGTANNGQSAGGVAGFLNGTIAGTYASGKVTAPSNTGAIVATLYKPGSETGSITSANGFYGTNAALEGIDPNGNAYRYLDGTSGNPIEVQTGFVTETNLKGNYYYQYLHNSGLRSASTAEGYAKDADNINDGYPVLYWQADPEAAEVDLSDAAITAIPLQTYTGKAIEPQLTVKLGSTSLYRGNDYIVKWENNVAVTTDEAKAKAKATLYGVGRYFGHTATVEFEIDKTNLEGASISEIYNQWAYDDQSAEPLVTVKDSNGNALKDGIDYKREYAGNATDGTATLNIVPVTEGVQVGSSSTTFKVTRAATSFAGGAGTEESPYQISNRKELQLLAHKVAQQDAGYLGKHYKVTADFSCVPGEGEAYNQTIGYLVSPTGIAGENPGFYGTFDGGGHTITLALNDESRWSKAATTVKPDSRGVALFGCVNNLAAQKEGNIGSVTTIKNLTVAGTVSATTASSYVAGFVADSYYSRTAFKDCVNEVTVSATGSSSMASGFVARAFNIELDGCTNKGSVNATGNSAGFVAQHQPPTTNNAGIKAATVLNCANKAAITTSGSAGAIVGDSTLGVACIVQNSSNAGNVTGTGTSGSVGGIVGSVSPVSPYGALTIDSCYNAGDVTMTVGGNTSGIGGIFGKPSSANSKITIASCYNSGKVAYTGSTAKNVFIGGLAGFVVADAGANNPASTKDISGYSVGDVSGQTTLNAVGYALGLYQCNAVNALATTVSVLGLDSYSVNAIGKSSTTTTTSGADPKTAAIDTSAKKSAADLKAVPSELGSAFVADSATDPVNGGYPVLYWQSSDTATLDISQAVASSIDPVTATGKQLLPGFTLTYDNAQLVAGADYVATYSDNVNAGTATVTVRGLGRFGGSEKTLTFTINGIALTSSNTAVTGLKDAVYTGDEVTQVPTVTYAPSGGTAKKLTANTNYTVEYSNNRNAGTASVFINGAGIYEGTVKATFTISPASFDDVTIEGIEDVYPDTGEAVELAPVLSNGAGRTLAAGADYTWEILDKNGMAVDALSNAGAYTAVFTPKEGGNYEGDARSVPFDIGVFLTVYRQVGDGAPSVAKTYSHKEFLALVPEGAQEPVSGMYYKSGAWHVTTAASYVLLEDLFGDAGLSADWKGGAKISYGGDPLQGKQTQVFDYDTFMGMSKFYPATAGDNVDFTEEKDAPAVLSVTEMSGASASDYSCGKLEADNVANANHGNEPRLLYGVNKADLEAGKAEWGGTTTRGMRYWSSNEQVTVIVPAIDLKDAVVKGAENVTFTGSAIEPAVTVELDGQLVDPSGYDVEYSGNVNAGQATVTVRGKGSYQGEAHATFTIAPASLAGATVSVNPSSYTYDGTAKEPAVSVQLAGKTVPASGYAVSYADNTAAGTAQVTVTGRGNYTGSASAPFAITAAPASDAAATSSEQPAASAETPSASAGSIPASSTKSGSGITTGETASAGTGSAAATVEATSATTVAYVAPASKSTKKVTVPATVKVNGKTYKVTSIAASAFKNSKATSVTVGKNVVKIGKFAFQGAAKLKTVTLGKSVKTIGKNAFSGAKKLTKVTLKSSKLTKASLKNMVKGSKIKTVKLSGVSAKAKKSYKKWAKSLGVTVK